MILIWRIKKFVSSESVCDCVFEWVFVLVYVYIGCCWLLLLSFYYLCTFSKCCVWWSVFESMLCLFSRVSFGTTSKCFGHHFSVSFPCTCCTQSANLIDFLVGVFKWLWRWMRVRSPFISLTLFHKIIETKTWNVLRNYSTRRRAASASEVWWKMSQEPKKSLRKCNRKWQNNNNNEIE